MAQSYEYPPALVQHRLLGFERSHGAPTTFRLSHHYFLTRLKLALTQVYRDKPTEYLLHGLYRELFNFLYIHGSCSALALNVPCPYFVQELLLGQAFQPGNEHQSAAVARLLIAAEVSERDEAFVRTVAGPEAKEWWYGEDPEDYPPYGAVLAFINKTVQQFWEAGQLRRLPVSYIDAMKYLLDLWLDADGAPSKEPGGATGPASRPETAADNGALDSGDVEMSTDSTSRSENIGKSDPLMGLALHLDLILPETPLLSEEDRHDLALLDKLTQAHTRLQQVLGLETEIGATERWNFDAVTQLLDLANQISSIPFSSRAELFDLEPTSAESVSAPRGSASKGKGRLEGGPKKRSLYHMLPDEARRGWAGSGVNPLPPKPLSSEVQDFNRLLFVKFPELFGPKADHHCQYREHLFQLVAADLQQSSTQKVAALLSSKNSKAPLDFGRLHSTLVANAGAGPSVLSRGTASSAGPIPNLVECTPSASLPTVEEVSLAIQCSSQPTPYVPSGPRAVSTPSLPSLPPPQRIESSPDNDSTSGLFSQPGPDSSSEGSSGGSSGWESESSSDGEDDTARIEVDFEGPGVTFSTSNTM